MNNEQKIIYEAVKSRLATLAGADCVDGIIDSIQKTVNELMHDLEADYDDLNRRKHFGLESVCKQGNEIVVTVFVKKP